MRRWWPFALLLALLLALQAKLWWGEGNLHEARELRQRVTAQRIENEQLQLRNDALSSEVEDLKSGEAAVEERARSELGMVKPGETFYRVVEPARERAAAPASETDAEGPPEAEIEP